MTSKHRRRLRRIPLQPTITTSEYARRFRDLVYERPKAEYRATMLNSNPEDDWAQVELYRWQYGELPGPDSKPLSEVEALQRLAAAIDKADLKDFPTPCNLAIVLRYVARLIAALTPPLPRPSIETGAPNSSGQGVR